MELLNFKAIVAAAVVNFLIGFLWYNEKVFGKVWMAEAGLDKEKIKDMNMPLVMGLSLLFAFLIALTLNSVVIHQMALGSLMNNHLQSSDAAVKAAAESDMATIMGKYGSEFRSFKHGALHGTLCGLLFILPIIATNALYERKSWKYILINAGYWTVSFAIMGAIICGWPN